MYLHQPPIRDRIHLQLPMEDCDLEDSHPAEKPNFEEQQREEVGLRRTIDCLRSILAAHRSDGEILEEDADDNGKGEIY